MKTVLVVVAHSDDESLWVGGTLLRLHDVSLIVICLTNRSNTARAREFRAACDQLGAKGLMLDVPEGGLAPVPELAADIERLLIQGGISPRAIDLVLTHSPDGNERGHPQHIACFKRLSSWCASVHLPLGFFSTRPIPALRVERAGYSSLRGVRAVRFSLSGALFDVVREFLRHLPSPRRSLIKARNLLRTQFGFRGFQAMIVVPVDLGAKHALLASHDSQLAGLRQYAAYLAPREYLYLPSGREAAELTEVL